MRVNYGPANSLKYFYVLTHLILTIVKYYHYTSFIDEKAKAERAAKQFTQGVTAKKKCARTRI